MIKQFLKILIYFHILQIRFGREWKKIEDFIGTKTVIQVPSSYSMCRLLCTINIYHFLWSADTRRFLLWKSQGPRLSYLLKKKGRKLLHKLFVPLQLSFIQLSTALWCFLHADIHIPVALAPSCFVSFFMLDSPLQHYYSVAKGVISTA